MELVKKLWNAKTSRLSEEEKQNLKVFKYHGADDSFLFKYCWAPAAEILVCCLPSWIAPNLITLSSFLVRVASFALISYYSWNMNVDMPVLPCAFFGIGYLMYIILDDADGKQARKTGNSSPIGLLFDHGCDALDTVLLSLDVCSILKVGRGWGLPIFMMYYTLGVYSVFLEEYHVGVMRLPMINGISDICVLYYLFSFLSSYVGCQVFDVPFLFGMNIRELFISTAAVWGTIEISVHYLGMYKAGCDAKKVLVDTLAYAMIAATLVTHFAFTSLPDEYIRPLIFLYGCMTTKLVFHTLVARTTAVRLRAFRLSTVVSCAVVLVYLLSPLKELFAEEYLMWVLVPYNVVSLLLLCTGTMQEMADVLGIRIFRVKETPN